jgi:hypothetical protein
VEESARTADPPSPFGDILDAFIERIDSLAEHLKLSMLVIGATSRELRKSHQEFIRRFGVPIEGNEDWVTIPPDHHTKLHRLQKRLDRIDIAVSAVPRSFVVTLVSEFDAFLSAILRTFYSLHPESLSSSQRTMTYAELTEFPSIEAAREHVLEKDIETFLRSSHTEQFDTLENKVGISLRKNLAIWPTFIELTERRNLFVHNQGVVNRLYIDNCKRAGYDCSGVSKGDTLEVSSHYFATAHETLHELGVKLAHVLWRKLMPETDDKADAHLAGTVMYDLLVQKRYKQVRALSEFALGTFKKVGSDYFRKALIVNRAQAFIWDGKREEGLHVLEKQDWSAAKDEFHVCVSALKGNIDETVAFMRSLGTSERPGKTGYREWPVFTWARKQQPFQGAFEEIFGEPLAVVEVSERSGEVSADPPTDTGEPENPDAIH